MSAVTSAIANSGHRRQWRPTRAGAVLFGLIHAEQAFAAVKFEHLAVNLDFAFAHPDQARLHIDREKQSRRSVPVITYTATAPLSTFRSEPIFLLGQ